MKLARLPLSLGLLALGIASAGAAPPVYDPLPIEVVRFQGLSRSVRFYRPHHLSARPALVLALHGSGGNGERFRRLTDRAFERLADEHGFVVAYPDAVGGQWNDCRARAPYRAALAGIDDVGFLREIARRATDVAGRKLAGIFLVGYSNGGHLAFRAALTAPDEFQAFAAIGAHLPVDEELGCAPAEDPVSILLVSGTEDPINPFGGGEVHPPGGGSPGRVRSAEATARYFAELAGTPGEPVAELCPDKEADDGTRVETRRWSAGRHGVELMVVHGGGHALPSPTGRFPEPVVGRTSRDLDGAAAIWRFFSRQMAPR